MLRRLLALGPAAALLTVAAVLPAAADAAGCAGVKGTRVLTTPSVKVVSQPVQYGARYVGCAKPNGPLRVLGTRTRGVDDAKTSLSIVKSAGRFLLVRTTYYEGIAQYEGERRYVVDLKNGKRRTLWRIDLPEGECPEVLGDPNPIGRPKQFVLGSNGVAAGVFVGGYCTQPGTRVVAFAPGKADRELDRGPNGTIAATSLRLQGRTVRWRSGGKARSAKV